MKWPNLKHLHYLITLYEEKHFHRAAERCFVSQSTLSTAIQTLEEQLGCQLLERDHKTFLFTPIGHEIVEKSRHILLQMSDVMEYANTTGDWQKGKLILGSIPTIAPFMFSDIVQTLHTQLPDLTLHLREDTTSNLLQQLSEGQVDLLLLALPWDTPGCKQMRLGEDPFKLIVHDELDELIPDPLDYTKLPKDSVFLLRQEHCMTEHAVSACKLKEHEQLNSLAASSLHTLVELANSKLGLTFLPEMAINHGIINNSHLKALSAEVDAFREIGLVWRNGSTRMQLFRRVGELISELLPRKTFK
jgi:LysR family hydrogen peroxide-inducible transcriptional activator